MKTQVEIENENLQTMIDKAIQEYDKSSKNGTLSDTKPATKIVPWYVGELASKLDDYLAEIMSGKAKVKPMPAKTLTVMDSVLVAHYTVKGVIDHKLDVNIKSSLTHIASEIAKGLSVEYKLTLLEKHDKSVKNNLVSYINRSTYVGKRKLTVTSDLLSKYHSQVVKEIDINFIKLALFALELLSECQPIINNMISPPLFTIESTNRFKGDKGSSVILLPWFRKWIMNKITNGELLTATHTAMVEPPIEWTGMTGGGFHTEKFKYDLIKTTVEPDKYYGVDMSETLKAVNKVQNTKWRINYRILEVMKYAKDNNLGYGDLPRNIEITRMPYPFPDKKVKELTDEEKVILKEWRKHTTAQHDEKASEDSKFMSMFRTVEEAIRFQDYSEIYFAYFLDFRGRMYPKASNLHPQGTDYIKALLEFSDGKAITDMDAEMFLAMQGANSFGIDKETFVNKHKWVLENEKGIIESANNPYDPNTLWHQCTEDPWQFLAFCFEWADYRTYGTNFKSHLPIAMDGSCNGLQHLGAMFMDEVGGKSVNLTNNTIKGDIYSDVKDRAIEILKKENSDLGNSILKFGITRKAVKRPVMIVPYAGTSRACKNYIKAEIDSKGAESYFKDDYFDALTLYSNTVWQAIGDIILKGREAMEFLGKTASKIIKANKSLDITWTTPNGFRVIQRKTDMKNLDIKTPLGDNILVKKYRGCRIKLDTKKTSVPKHKSSIAPNLVHSLDSCHLQNTVNMMPESVSLAMIHDSYGTHAADSRTLFKAIRRAFYEQYKDGDVLDKFLAQQPPVDTTDKPTCGTLDLKEVLDSEHFFS